MQQIIKLLRQIAFGWLCLVLFPPAGNAEDSSSYQVEVVVFEHLANRDGDGEGWDGEAGLPNIAGAVELSSAAGTNGVTKIPDYDLLLQSDRQRLVGNSAYRVLLHTGWRQPKYSMDDAVHVYSGDSSFLASAAPVEGLGGAAIPVGPGEKPGADGVIRVHSGPSPTVSVDIAYRNPGVLGTNTARLTEVRTIRAEETHYLDHPLFGVLVRVTPPGGVPIPAAEPEPSGGADAAPAEE
jgi:hypothetical protein